MTPLSPRDTQWNRALDRRQVRRRTRRARPGWAMIEPLEERALLSHFRFGTISWETLPSDASGKTVQFKVEQSWRSSFFGSSVAVGSTINNVSTFNFGDGTSAAINLTVSSVNAAEDYFVGTATLTRVYATAGDRIAYMESNARLSTLQNNRDGAFRTETNVNVGTSNDSPVSSMPPILQVPDNGVFTYQVPAVDPNGNPLSFRLSTSSEAGGFSAFSQPANFSISSTGLITWDVGDGKIATVPGDLWSAQIMVSDGSAKIPLDFLLKIGQPAAVNQPPTISANPAGPFQPVAGQTLSFTVTATDPDATGSITNIQATNAPAGMTLGSFTAGKTASRTVTWTPTQQQANASIVVTFVATDNGGATAQTSVTITPQANQPPTANAGGPYQVDEGSTLTLSGSGSDPEGSAVALAWDLDYDGSTFNVDATGATPTFDARQLDGPTTRTVALRVTDALGLQQIATAQVNVLNVAPRNVAIVGSSSAVEGGTVVFSPSFSDPGAADTHTFHWHVFDADNNLLLHEHTQSINFLPPDNGVYRVYLDVVDDDLGQGSASAELTVTNVAPTATLSIPATAAEGSVVTVALTGAADPSGADTTAGFEYAFDFGTGYGAWSSSNSAVFTPPDDGTYPIKAKVRDKDLGEREYTGNLVVTNVAPTLWISGNSSINEGSTYTLNLSASDPGNDTISQWVINWGDGSAPQTVAGNPGSVTHLYVDGTRNFTITATATDEDGSYTARAQGSNAQASLDPSFGDAGEVIQNLDGATADYIRALTVVQPDGKVLVAGYTAGGTTRLALARYNTNGSLDTGFGAAGTVLTEFGTSARAESILLDGAGNILVAGTFGLARYTPNGTLDTSFGNGGRLTGFTSIRKAVFDGAGNILVGNGSQFARFQPNGAFDLSFGSGGITPYLGYSYNDFALAPDGKIVTIQNRSNGNVANRNDVIVRRHTANGQGLDTGFGQQGQYVFDSGLSDSGVQVSIQQNKILVGGIAEQLQQNPSNPNSWQTLTQNVLLFRLAADGQALDSTFGQSGSVVFRYNQASNSYDYFYGMGVDPSGRIIVSGSYGQYRFSADGAYDAGFGGTYGYAPRIVYPYSGGGIAFDGSKIYLGGYLGVGNEGANFAVQRFLDNGTPDSTFDNTPGDGNQYYVQTGFSGPLADYIRQVTVRQSDGKVIVAGYTSGGTTEIVLARYLPDGQLDAGFGTPRPGDPAGIIRTGINSSVSTATVDASGNIYVADGFYLYKFLPSGSRDTTTTTNGFSNGQRYAQGVYIQALKIDSAGRLVVGGYKSQPLPLPGGGYDYNSYSYDFAVARFSANGVPDNNFGVPGADNLTGVATLDLNSTSTIQGDQLLYGMAIDGSNRIVAVGYTRDYDRSTNQYSALKALIVRFSATNGQLDPTFNPSGSLPGALVTTGADNSYSRTVAIDSQGRIVVGFSTAVHRYNPDGSVDTSFNGTGSASNSFYGIQALLVDGVDRVVTAGSGYLGRFNASGTPDTSFGPSGWIYNAGRSFATLAVDGSDRILGAGSINLSGSTGTDYWLARYITGGLAVTVNNVAPTINSLTGPSTADEGGSVTLTATATDPAGAFDPLTYSWTVYRNGNVYLQASGASLTFSVPDNGSYLAYLTVDDGDGGYAYASRSIAVANVAPTATFNAPATGTEATAFSVSLTDAADASSVDQAEGFTYAFDFGTGFGAYSSSNTATFTPPDDGTYTVKGRIRDKDGGVSEYTATVVVTNVAPTAVNDAATTAEDTAVTINVVANDTDPAGVRDPLAVVAVTDGAHGTVTFSGGTVTYTPAANFSCTDTFTYTISDGDGGYATASVAVTITPVADAPTVAASDASGDEGAAIPLSIAISLTDVDGSEFLMPVRISGVPAHATLNHGTYDADTDTWALDPADLDGLTITVLDNATFTLTVTGFSREDGPDTLTAEASATFEVVVTNVAPTIVEINPDATTIDEGGTVTLSGRFTDPGTLDAHVVTVDWGEHGKKAAEKARRLNPGATQFSNISHTYDDNGTYEITVTIADEDGGSDSWTFTLVVNNVAPTATLSNAGPVDEGSPVTVAFADPSDPGPVDTDAGFRYSFATSLGGLATTYDDALDTASATFTFDDDGTHLVYGRIFDKDGGYTDVTTEVVVNNVAPTAAIVDAPTTGVEGTSITLTSSVTDVSSVDADAGFTYAWVVTRTRNGATEAYATGSDSSFTLSPDDDGTYHISLVATDKDGASSEVVTADIVVANVAPTAAILGAPDLSTEGTTLLLSSSVTDASSADQTAGYTYHWVVTRSRSGGATFEAYAQGTTRNFLLNLDDDGLYRITLTATDKDGSTSEVASAEIYAANVAPTVSIVDAPATGTEGTSITLTSTVTDASSADRAAGFTYQWAVYRSRNGGGYQFYAAGTGASYVLDPDDDGLYSVRFWAVDKDHDASNVAFAVITVANAAPTASIVNAPATGTEGTSITLGSAVTDASTVDRGGTFTYQWTVTRSRNGGAFEAYSTGAAASFVLDPDDDGVYRVALTATDKDGATSAVASADIVVANARPTASILGAPATGVEGTSITLTSSVTDVSSVDADAGFTYAWVVTRTRNGATEAYATGSASSFTLSPDDDGTYHISLVATDKDGASSEVATADIVVANVAPTATITGIPTGAVEGSPITLGTSPSDPSSVDTNAGFTYSWVVTRSRNGGAFLPYTTGTAANLTFTPNDDGLYEVTLTVTDKDNASTVTTTQIAVENAAPVASIASISAVRVEGTAIVVTGSATDAGPLDTLTYSWAVFKDGEATPRFTGGNTTTFTFTPPDNGSYRIVLTARDGDNAAGTAEQTISVANVAPTVAPLAGPSRAVRGQALGFQGSFADPGVSDGWTATVNYGDGTGNQAVALQPNKGFTLDHSFAEAGTYSIVVTVRDKDGGVGQSAAFTVTVGIWDLLPDPSGQGTALYIGGSNGNDTILVNPGSGSTPIKIKVNGDEWSVPTPPDGHIIVFGQDGDDSIQVAGLTIPTILFGGAGNDTIKGGNGLNIIVGGAGNDSLTGGNNRDLIIGGDGTDQLNGGAGDDLLIGMRFAGETNLTTLLAVMDEWSSSRDYATRVGILTGAAGYAGRPNFGLLADDTLFDDLALDVLAGAAGNDLFLAGRNNLVNGSNGDIVKRKP